MVASLIPSSSPAIPGAPTAIPGTPQQVPKYGDLAAPSGVTLRSMQGRFVTNGFGYEWYNLVELFDQPQTFAAMLVDSAKENMRELAVEIQEYAQEHAPWQDRTGDARAGLKALFIDRSIAFEIDLGHSVSYGYFLENYNGGQYAIIQPTLREFAPSMANISQHLREGVGDIFVGELQ